MNYYYFIIVTNKDINIPNNIDCLIINNECKLNDENHLLYNKEEYEFTYLIFDNSNLLKYHNEFITEYDEPITNFYYQTSIDNIYYLNKKIENINDVVNEIISEN